MPLFDNILNIMSVVYVIGAIFFAYRVWLNGRKHLAARGYKKPFRKVLLTGVDIPPLSEALQPLDRRLNEFGFDLRYAEQTQQKPNAPGTMSFDYLAHDGYTIAQMALLNNISFVFLLTRFRDNAALATTFPRGENIQTPHFTARYAAFDLHMALTHHQQMIETWTTQKGKPVHIQTDEQMDAVEQWYNQTHLPRMNHRYAMVFLLIAVLSAVASLWLALLAINGFMGGDLTFFDITAFGVLLVPLLEMFLTRWLTNPSGAVDEGMPSPKASPIVVRDDAPEAEPLLSEGAQSEHPLNRPPLPAVPQPPRAPSNRPVRLTQLLWFLPFVVVAIGLGVSVFNPGILSTLIGSAKMQLRTPNGWTEMPLPGDIARGLEYTADGTVWALTATDLYRWIDEVENWQSIYSTRDNIVEMTVDGTLIWLISSKAVIRCDSTELRCDSAHELVKGSSIAAFDDQVLAVSTDGATLHYDGANWRSFNLAGELPDFDVNRAPGYLSNVAITSDNTLWIEWGQLWRRSPDSQEWILATYGQQPPVNVEIIGAADDYLWTGWSNGISEDEPDLDWWTFFYWEDVGGNYNDRLFDMTEAPDGSVWFGVENGLLHYNDGGFELIALPENERVLEVLVTPGGEIWAQTSATGVTSWLSIVAALGIILFLLYSMRRAVRGLM